MNPKEMLRSVASRGLVASGVTRLCRRLRDDRGTLILYGHRVRDDDEGYLTGLSPAWFREQVTYLTRHYEVIPLDTLVKCVEQRRAPPRRSVVLTFDDGFRDNVEVALPILDGFGVSATIFVVTRSLTTGELPWSQRLGFLFQHSPRSTVELPRFFRPPVSLTSLPERRAAYVAVKHQLTSLPRAERDRFIDELARLLDVEPPNDRMMTWDHARQAIASGHAIGAHTYSHQLLARVTVDEARREMARSRDDVIEHMGVERPAFCFPAGSVNDGLIHMARELGFRSAFRPNRARRINRGTDGDPFSLVRVGMPNASAAHLEAELDGPFHGIRSVLGRYRT